MARMSEAVKQAVSEIRPSMVATASKSGKPNVSAKGSLRVLDDEHLIFADTNSLRTIANLLENPQVSIILLNAARLGCRIWGQAEVISSGELIDTMNAHLAQRGLNLTAKHAVKIKVDEAIAF